MGDKERSWSNQGNGFQDDSGSEELVGDYESVKPIPSQDAPRHNASSQPLPPGRRITRHSGATRLPGSDSETETEYSSLGFTVAPNTMDASNITAYINLLPEYTQYMDLLELVTTNDEDCRHHLEIFQNWRQLRYPSGIPFEFINGRPKRPMRPASLGPSSLKLRTRGVITYKQLVDDAKSSGFRALKQAPWVKLFDYLVICYVHLDDENMSSRILDHEKLLRLASNKVSKECHAQWAIPPGALNRPSPVLNEHPNGPVVAIDELVMKPDNFTNVPHWDQIVGNHGAKKALWNSIMVRKRLPSVVNKVSSFLLFGPTGTGKTAMVKAMARLAGFACMEMTSDFIRKEHVGQSEAIFAKIFSHARATTPCLIFLDEAEDLLGTKEESTRLVIVDEAKGSVESASATAEAIYPQFLKQILALNNSDDDVWIVAATHKPWLLSAAMRQRFSVRIYVPLPDKSEALELFKHHLKNLETRETGSGLKPFTLEKGTFGQELDRLIGECFRAGQKCYFSGNDFERAAENIPSMLYDEIEDSPFFRRVVIENQQRIIHVKDGAEQGAFRKPVSEFSDEELDMLKFRAIGIADAREALQNIHSVITEGSIKSFEDWNQNFGTGAKRQPVANPVGGGTQPSRRGRGDCAAVYDLTRYIPNFR